MSIPKVPGKEVEETPGEQKVNRKGEVNGIEFFIEYDPNYQKYLAYFPQIDLYSEEENNPPDQVLIISEEDKAAEKTYDYICQAGLEAKDVNELYRMTEVFINENFQNQEE